MLKKHVLKRLLPLLFSFCCVFSGFLSVEAFALDSWYNVNTPVNAVNLGSGTVMGSVISSDVLDPDEYGWYRFDNAAQSLNAFRIRFFSSSWHVVLSSEYDYYFTILLESDDIANFNLNVNSVSVREHEYDSNPNYTGYYLRSLVVKNYDGTRMGTPYKGLSITGKYDALASGNIAQILFNCPNSTLPAGLIASINLFQVPVDTSESDVQKIVNAINNQTSSITGNIDKNTDDIQQSIEDQYEVDPDEDFNVDDIISEHTEKMGVLSFGSDVMLQFLDMFQSANVGSAELTLPGFNIAVEGVDYAVWPDYSFNFEQLNDWVPALMSVIRVMLPAFVWLMVLRYCIKVFEDNFLAK